MSLLMLCSHSVTVVYLPAALLRAQTLVFCSVDVWFWGFSPSRGEMLHLSGMVCHLHFTAWDLLWWTYVTYLISLTSLIIKKWIENGSFGVFRGQSRLLAITSFNRVHITSHSTFIEIIFLSCPIFKTESYLLKVADFPPMLVPAYPGCPGKEAVKWLLFPPMPPAFGLSPFFGIRNRVPWLLCSIVYLIYIQPF